MYLNNRTEIFAFEKFKMGSSLSRNINARPPPTTEQRDLLKATNTYYGPNFVLERDGVPPSQNSNRAYWDDIVNLLSGNGTVNLDEIRALGDLYSQLPPAEVKQATTITAAYNLQRGSLNLSKLDTGGYNFEFKYDSTVACFITLYWGVRLELQQKNGEIDLNFVGNEGNTTVKWKFGPFPPGINQTFTLPADKVINEKLLSLCDMKWVTELDLNGIVAPTSPNMLAIPIEEIPSEQSETQQTVSSAIQPDLTKTTTYHVVIELSTSDKSVVEKQVTMCRFAPRQDGKIGLEYTKKIAIVY